MDKEAPIFPAVTKALFIGSSKYLDEKKSLPQANQDVRAVKKFFKDHMKGFEDPTVMIDKKAEQIDKVFNDDFLSCARNAKDFK